MRLIDRDELLATFERDVDVNVTGRKNAEEVKRVLQTIYDDIKDSPVMMEWIPVTERLPDEHYISGDMVEFSDAVLATIVNHEDNENRFIDIIYTQEGRWKRCNADTDRTTIPDWCEVVAWMPLPEPYKEGEEHEAD